MLKLDVYKINFASALASCVGSDYTKWRINSSLSPGR